MMAQTSIESRGSEKPRVQSSTTTHFVVLNEARNMVAYTREARKLGKLARRRLPMTIIGFS